MAAADYTTVVQQLYVSYFGRPADYFGMQNFAAALDAMKAPKTFAEISAAIQADKAGTTALSTLVSSFSGSTESASLYGTVDLKSEISIGKFVNAIYQNLLSRDADSAGFKFWVDAIKSGGLNPAKAAASITAAAMANTTDQGKLDAATISNKVAVANTFTTAIDTPAEITAYAGDAAAAAARALVYGVNNTTVLTAYQANIDATLNSIVSGSTPGTTTALTAGVDTLPGTAGNDVFNALSVIASGAPGNTLTNFDSIDGGAGKDTLNIYTDVTNNFNTSIGANTTIKNVETVNIFNANGAAALADASKYAGVTALWQIGAAGNVTNLDSATTAGFRSLAVGAFGVAAADAAASATVALDGVVEDSTFNVTAGAAGKLAAVTISGTVTDGADAGSTAGDAKTNLNVTVGKDVQTLAVNSSLNTNLSITNGAGTKALTTINAAGSTGAITYADAETTVASITTGSAKDDVTVVTATVKDDTTTAADETINATVNTGAGADKINVNVTGTGAVNVVAGDGDDTVNVTGRGTATLNVDLGAGNDTFTSGVAINATDKIDAGAGSDTLLLNLVGAANVGAFSNFDAFDAKLLARALDVEILSQKNTVTEIVASGDVGAGAALQNVGAGVGYRVTGDTNAANALAITQKTAGDLTVTLDIDESGTTAATTTAANVDAAVSTNATGVKAVFDSAFVGAAKAAGDNVAELTVTATAAKTLAVESGGANAANHIIVGTVGNASAALTTVTVTGAQQLTLDLGAAAAKLATIDASAQTGGLVTSLANVIDGGSIKLGSGVDKIAVTNASTVGAVESISGFEKTLAVSVSTAGADATAKAAAIADADTLSFAGAVAADGGAISKGVLSFSGTGPTTLAEAAGLADAAVGATVGTAVVFEYLGNSYVFVQGGATDTLVQLAGVTGVKNFVENGATDTFFIV